MLGAVRRAYRAAAGATLRRNARGPCVLVAGALWLTLIRGSDRRNPPSIIASFIFSMESFWVHAIMTSLLAAMIGLLVFFMLVTDLPYRGASGIGPESYELVFHDLMQNPADR